MNERKLLVVDDDKRLRELLERYLGEQGFVVHTAEDADAMDRALAHEAFDLVVLDLMLPGEDGLSICRRLRSADPQLAIMMLTAKGDEIDRIVGLEMGADDYLPKPFNPRELLARVRSQERRGTSLMPESQFQVADLTLDLISRKVSRGGVRIALTSKEFTLLEYFIRHQGEVLPRALIASQVWDMNFDSDTNVIDVAVKRLRVKIDNDFEPKLIQTVRGVGYVLEVPDGN